MDIEHTIEDRDRDCSNSFIENLSGNQVDKKGCGHTKDHLNKSDYVWVYSKYLVDCCQEVEV